MKTHFNFKFYSFLFFLLLKSGFFYSQNPVWQIVTPKYPTTDAVVAGYVVDADEWGQGDKDATGHIQTLLNSLNRYTGDPEHGGGVVFLPEGKYRIDGNLTVPKGVTLRGDWEKPLKGQAIHGTILLAYSGKGDPDGIPFITMAPAAALMDIAIWYPEQDAANITPYPHAIQYGIPGYFGNEFCNAKNLTLVNAYSGLHFYIGGGTCPVINGLYGTPLKKGVEIDNIVDVGRIEWCDFSPDYWAGSGLPGAPALNGPHKDWIYKNGTGIVMRRNDWSYSCYISVEGYNKGFYATPSANPNDRGTPNGHHYGFHFKNCHYGLYFDGSNGVGIMFTEMKMENCAFGVYLSPQSGGRLQLYKWDIDATAYAIFSDEKSSTTITLQESTVKNGKVCLQGGVLLAMDNDFDNDAPQITFEAGGRGNIVSNRFKDAAQIQEKSVYKSNIDHAPVAIRKLPAYKEFVPLVKKPARNVMYNVLDAPYSVKKGTRNNIPAEDATPGIQQALNQASEEGGGVVYLPPGHYRINGSLTVPTDVELKGGIDVGTFPLGPGSVLEIYGNKNNENGPSPVILKERSGIRGMVFNYPEQVWSNILSEAVMKGQADVLQYPYAIQGQGNDVYIINTGVRAAYKAVDLGSYRCDNFYVDYLTGQFWREGISVKNSDNGIIANMQCNTIVYACGDESKFGGWPNSNRVAGPYNNPYLYNSLFLNFMILENVQDIFLYNDFNYCALNGISLKDNVSGLAIGFALDNDNVGVLIDGNNINLDFINTQDVALDEAAEYNLGSRSTYLKTTDKFISGSVGLFSSDYWGWASQSGIVMNGPGTVSLQSAVFSHSGVNSFARINQGILEMNASFVSSPNNNNPLINGSSIGGAHIQGSMLTPTSTNINNLGTWQNNITGAAEILITGAIDRTGWIAAASYTSEGNPQYGIDGNTNTRWTSGWQNQGAGQGNVYYQVDMRAPQTFNQIILEYSRNANDGPENYTVEVSDNGTEWKQVASGKGSAQLTNIFLPQQTAQYIRINKLAGSTKAYYWGISELYVLNGEGNSITRIPGPYSGTPVVIPGKIEAEDFDFGGEGYAYHDTDPGNTGNAYYRMDEDLDIGVLAGGEKFIDFEEGEWSSYTVNATENGFYNIRATASAGQTNATFSIEIDGEELIGDWEIPAGDPDQFISLKEKDLLIPLGVQVITVKAKGKMRIAGLEFKKQGTPYQGEPFHGPHLIPGVLEAEDFDLGGEGLAYHDTESATANAYRENAGVKFDINYGGTDVTNVAGINAGEWLRYTVNVEDPGLYNIDCYVASTGTEGRFRLLMNGVDEIAVLQAPNTGGWSNWSMITAENALIEDSGEQYLEIRMEGGNFNLDKLVFRKKGTGVPASLSGGEIRIYAGKNKLLVQSAADDPVREICIFDMQGRKIMQQGNLNQPQVSVALPQGNRLLIVKIQTEKAIATKKVMGAK
jgi:hypothetical protein